MKETEESAVLENFIDALLDMKIIDSSNMLIEEETIKKTKVGSYSEPKSYDAINFSTADSQIIQKIDSIPLQVSEFRPSQIDADTETIIDLDNSFKAEVFPPLLTPAKENICGYYSNCIDKSKNEDRKVTESEEPSEELKLDAFGKLQDILVGSELNQLDELTETIKESLDKLETQIYDSEKLINLLLPTINELLRRNIAESKEDLVRVILPIVDRSIEARVEQDKDAMGSVLSAVISSAITKQVIINPDEVAAAIAPTIGKAMKQQVDIEQDAVVDALYPIIGNTIAKYMGETIEAINSRIEDTFSVEGIKRKIRAKIQGVSEAELIVKESLPYKIQAVFLIHKSSGLVISDVQPQDSEHLESEMIAGMLTAIRSFANDCINQSGTVAELDAINYGTSKIFLEVAGYCYLAIISQGDPPPKYIKQMRQILTKITRNYGQFIKEFDGDPDNIPPEIGENLAPLVEKNQKDKKSKGGVSPLVLLAGMLLGVIFVPWGIWHFYSSSIRSVEIRSANSLDSTPELSVYRLDTKVENNKIKLTGKLPNSLLRSKAENIVKQTFPEWSIDNQILAVEVPADPVLTAAEVKRVTKVLNQVPGIDIYTQFADNKVTIQGRIRENTNIKNIIAAFEQIPGVKIVSSTVQITGLSISTRFYFQENSTEFTGLDVESKVAEVITFLKKYPAIKVRIIGYSYSANNANAPQKLAINRAKVVKELLVNRGIKPSRILVSKSTDLPPGVSINQAAALKRCAIFEIVSSGADRYSPVR